MSNAATKSMETLLANSQSIPTSETPTILDAWVSDQILARRRAALVRTGDEARNSPAWQDLIAEQTECNAYLMSHGV